MCMPNGCEAELILLVSIIRLEIRRQSVTGIVWQGHAQRLLRSFWSGRAMRWSMQHQRQESTFVCGLMIT